MESAAAEVAESSRLRVNPSIRAALKRADARVFGGSEADWEKQMKQDAAGLINVASLVNYGTAPLGAKKYEASSLSR